jgi:hypothetical protein
MELPHIYTLPEPTADIEQGKRNLDRYGLTIHENFLAPEQVRQLRQRLEEQAALELEQGTAAFAFAVSEDSQGKRVGSPYKLHTGRPLGIPPYQAVTVPVNKGRVFIDLAKHPLALAYAQHVFQWVPFNVGTQLGIILRKHAPAQVIHTDQQFVPFATPIPLSMIVMVALSDYDEDMGATRVIPGSHLGPAPHQVADAMSLPTLAAAMRPGSALLWESRVWHGQGEVVSDKARYSVLTSYAVNFLKTKDNHAAAIHDDVYATLSEDERKLYDFDYFPYAAQIGPRYPADTRHTVGNPQPYVPELRRGKK